MRTQERLENFLAESEEKMNEERAVRRDRRSPEHLQFFVTTAHSSYNCSGQTTAVHFLLYEVID